ncbi:MAG: helical backbone metal receptor [Bacteroidia bacterium]|nr:helical backbone metal receptor [Bacteroidia bacterium]
MRILADDLLRKVGIPFHPKRVISLCPSVTETLYDIGAGNKIVGRTRFCIHPEPEIKTIEVVGGTKKIHFDRVAALQPDLIIAVKEENTPEMVGILEKSYPVFVLDIKTVEDGIRMIGNLGKLTGDERTAGENLEVAGKTWNQLKDILLPASVLYVIWQEPYMVAGRDTYIDSIIEGLGWKNAASRLSGRYPELSPDLITELDPDKILLSSEPFPFREKHIEQFRQLFPRAEVRIVDGEAFSWYGTHLCKSAAYFRSLI